MTVAPCRPMTLITRDVLCLLNRAGDAAGDECVQGWVGHGRLLWVTTKHGQVVSGAIRSGPAAYRRRRLVRISEVSEPAARAKHADQVGVRLQVGDARISTPPDEQARHVQGAPIVPTSWLCRRSGWIPLREKAFGCVRSAQSTGLDGSRRMRNPDSAPARDRRAQRRPLT
jgi:hypothetical protein